MLTQVYDQLLNNWKKFLSLTDMIKMTTVVKKKEEEEKQSQQSKSPWNTAARYPLNDQWVGTPCSAFKIFTFN